MVKNSPSPVLFVLTSFHIRGFNENCHARICFPKYLGVFFCAIFENPFHKPYCSSLVCALKAHFYEATTCIISCVNFVFFFCCSNTKTTQITRVYANITTLWFMNTYKAKLVILVRRYSVYEKII